MAGIPGSGKTTIAERDYPGALVCSADHFFMGEDGYRFDPKLLSFAHEACMRKFIDSLEVGVNQVLVDNTNVNPIDIAPYYAVARAYGYDVTIVRVLQPTTMFGVEEFVKLCAARNTHGVPIHTIDRMYRALTNCIIQGTYPPYWQVKNVHTKVTN